jgi:DNA-binding transcriptional MerR regulator
MTSTLRIADVAAAAGVSTATVRYYEQIGVLPSPARERNGYRSYDDRTVERLAFVARAKQLGCTLEEIRDLVTAWEGGECGPIQDRLRRLVAAKLAAAQSEVVDLVTLTAELRRAAAALELHRPEGACDEQCGCLTGAPDVAERVPVQLATVPAEEPPLACTLSGDDVPDRLEEWNALLGSARAERSAIPGGVRISFTEPIDVVELAGLASAEQSCCRFFTFRITIDDRGVALDVTAPAAAIDVVHAAFGAPA